MAKMKNVLLLGGTGRIGPSFVEEYFKKYKKFYNLIIGYHNKKPDYGLELRKIDLSDISVLKKAMEGIDVVVNFAAESNPAEENFEKILNPNIIGAYNVFEAAKEMNVKRVVFASSVHAIKGYHLGKKVMHDDYPRPANLYGASKVFGEALCYFFSSKYGISCLAVRIGAYTSDEMREQVCMTRENFDYVITQRDMAQLIHKCIIAPDDVKFGVLSGSSDNKNKYMDLEFTKKLVGYEPEDDAFEICDEIKKRDGKNE